ncbi:MAG: hypothetical protein AB1505_27645 [Candidatus Latescibacterota bacterium]
MHVAGRPILGHILDQLATAGVRRVVLVIGHLGEQIVDYVPGQGRLRRRGERAPGRAPGPGPRHLF